MNGQIVKIISNDYFVKSGKNEYICKARGKFRQENITPKVGDYVFFDVEEKIIKEIMPRKNTLLRPVVSNIDQAFIVTSLKEPDFSTNLLDKLICICILNKITPIICLTKKDLLERNEYNKFKKIINYYKKLGIKVIHNNQVLQIKKLLKNKTTVFTGQTGAGKSSLMNRLDKNLNYDTNEISKALGRGKHTTRVVSLVEINKGKVLDTPGFSDIDLSVYKKEDIRNSFKEFNVNCKYKNCMHINEEGCLVKHYINEGKILNSRYENYLKFIKKIK